ncbi:MAG: hypothetical protein M3124_02230 [Actinomycetota bacterium]|nr:hypothetical protein [Actinomycetota bacterium]
MLAKLIRFVSLALLGGIGLWWGRQVAHSKKPPPQGRWREIPESELRGS